MILGNSKYQLGHYYKEVSVYPPLTRDEEKEITQQLISEDENTRLTARNTLVERNLRLVISFAKKRLDYSPLPLDDLIQEGNLGLLKAVDRFDPTRGVRFASYACAWIFQSMRQAEKKASLIPLGAEPNSSSDEGDDQSNRKLVKILNSSLRVSINEKINHYSSEEWLNQAADPSPGPDELAVLNQKKEKLTQVLATILPAKEWFVLKKSFGLDGYTPWSLAQIGRELRISRERVRQLNAQALRRLKRPAYKEKLHFCIE